MSPEPLIPADTIARRKMLFRTQQVADQAIHDRKTKERDAQAAAPAPAGGENEAVIKATAPASGAARSVKKDA